MSGREKYVHSTKSGHREMATYAPISIISDCESIDVGAVADMCVQVRELDTLEDNQGF